MTAQLHEPLLTVQETAARLSISRRTVYDLIASGRMPAFRVGGQIRLSAEAVADWLVNHQTGPMGGKR